MITPSISKLSIEYCNDKSGRATLTVWVMIRRPDNFSSHMQLQSTLFLLPADGAWRFIGHGAQLHSFFVDANQLEYVEGLIRSSLQSPCVNEFDFVEKNCAHFLLEEGTECCQSDLEISSACESVFFSNELAWFKTGIGKSVRYSCVVSPDLLSKAVLFHGLIPGGDFYLGSPSKVHADGALLTNIRNRIAVSSSLESARLGNALFKSQPWHSIDLFNPRVI